MDKEVPLRITLLEPPRDVMFCLQRGSSELVDAMRSNGRTVSFDLTVRARDDGTAQPNFLGPFTQGPRQARFVYVNSGKRAGETGTGWDRRAKIPLGSITWKQIDAVLADPKAVLEARIAGTARDGGPCCATVPIPDGWTRVEA